ncbi:CcmD family protein [Cytophagales bacterium LB-30]|uniref:CcmD family protein n=1 Tax=Shiella aurantiaca TaxID=3058365 RepID=A0ABT8F2I1_9BACT|nr:CcmD family protein [Shiella aurantiaca]MDN4164615.1 CcmD family protein [Shiella aurantiaca]
MKALHTLKYWTILILLSLSLQAIGQEKQTITATDYSNQQIEMADAMRSNGKIYVVVSVILILFIGMSAYLVILDKKVTALEKKVKESAQA